LQLAEENKFLVPVTKGSGAGKDPNVVRRSIDEFYDDVVKFIRSKVNDQTEFVLVCIGGGGGTGGGLGIVIAQIATELGLNAGAIYTLPLMNESTLVFVNALDNLKEIHANAQQAAISPLIIVDNNKLVAEFAPTTANFWGPLNGAIVSVIRKFNEYSQKPSKSVSALDRQDLKRLLSTGGVCAVGQFDIPEQYTENVVDENIANHFFMDGFNLKTASACGVIVVGSEKTFQTQTSATAINTFFDKVSGLLDGGMFFRGVYNDENVKFLRVYILFNGLALPSEHIDEMMRSVRRGYNKIKAQQNRLEDGINVDFGAGVGGMFNPTGGAKKIERKIAVDSSADNSSAGLNVVINDAAGSQSQPKKVENNPIQIPGMKRRDR
jgi:cell division GTPase FtsZ